MSESHTPPPSSPPQSPLQPSSTPPSPSRRRFLRHSSAAVVGSSLAATLGSAQAVHAGGSETLRVGLIGCGSRGSSAAVNAAQAADNVVLVAMADVFPDQLKRSRQALAKRLGNKYQVTDDHAFSGFDGYLGVINSDVDIVLMATPPHFRPQHLRAAVEAGKHVFCEKPVAVDPTGVRSVLETTEMARKKNLSLVSGLCWRYDLGVRATMEQIQDGAIGDVVAIQENYLTGALWHRGREPQWSEMEYQLRNWLYFTWLSGDHIVEQHIHSLDKALWLMGDQPPTACFGLGGRQARTEEKWGHIYDHFAVCYEWENGVKTFAYTRQMRDCATDVDDYVLGTKGRAHVLGTRGRPRIIKNDGNQEWNYRGPEPSMYDNEHREMIEGIRSGNLLNNGVYMSYSTLMAIMGREACYTGQTIGWEEALNAEQDLSPSHYEWGAVSLPQSVAKPGETSFA